MDTFSQWPNIGTEALLQGGRTGRQLLAASTRVGTVGTAVFVILFFLGVCIAICLAGSRTTTPWAYYVASIIIFGVIFTVLAASPKGQPPPEPEYGYDQTIIPLTVITVLLVVGMLLGGVGMLVFHATPKVYARPLCYRADVLGIS